jgi:hypothetical protein
VEFELYAPVKAFLEAQGYCVKSEICDCDVVATRGDGPPVIVELKETFTLGLVLQGVNRLTMTDHVYLAVARPRGRGALRAPVYRRDVRDLCRRLGLGLMTVVPAPPHTGPNGDAGLTTKRARRTSANGASGALLRAGVDVILDPLPYQPRKRTKRLTRLLGEHARRVGDPNRGGVSRTPIMTAYRQEALRCALLITRAGRETLKALRETGLVPNAPNILRRDVYGWFERRGWATYGVTDRARQDIERFAAAGILPIV